MKNIISVIWVGNFPTFPQLTAMEDLFWVGVAEAHVVFLLH